MIVKLYNRNLKKIQFNEEIGPYDNGGNGNVYRYKQDYVLKIYHDTASSRLSYDVFSIIKHIDHSNFIKIYDVYKKSNNVFSAFYSNIHDSLLKCYIIDAYIAKFYQKQDIDILNESIEYTLYNFNELFHLFDAFSENSLEARDCICSNTVFTGDRIIIIDPDAFKKSYYDDKEKLKILNRIRFLKLFKDIYLVKSEYKYIMEVLNLFDLDETGDMPYELSKKLQGYKKPINYFNQINQ